MKSSRPRGPAGGPAAVRADQWGWRHAGRNAWAVRGLDLHVNAGERILLLGASGSGKSTLLAGIAGVLGGDDDGESEGRLFIDGAEPASNRGRAGLLLQDPESQTVLARVGDDVAFACENLAVPREAIWPRVQQSLDAVGLHVGIRHPTSALSGGQKQRLALAGLLAMQPGILLLDEPTANLDPEGVTEVRDAVAAVLERTGATLLVVEHRVDVWIDVVDRVVVLDGAGGVLADGVPAQVFEQKREQLAEAGVWLPDAQPAAAHTPGDPGSEMLTARDLVVARRRGAGIPIGELALRAGASLALTGANGSGKSTLALTLGGLLKHLAVAEDYKFTVKLSGAPMDPAWDDNGWDDDDDWEFASAADDSPEKLYALYDGAVERSRARVAEALHEAIRTPQFQRARVQLSRIRKNRSHLMSTTVVLVAGRSWLQAVRVLAAGDQIAQRVVRHPGHDGARDHRHLPRCP